MNLNELEEESQKKWKRLLGNGTQLPGKKKQGRNRRRRRREEEEDESLSGEDKMDCNAACAQQPRRRLEPQ